MSDIRTENKKRFIDNGGEMNFLIEGDNLAALKLLEKTHRGKIDLIYIDPPYNTGNKDFIYNDSFVDKTDGCRHSKWLSFMEKRLKIAKRLLSKNGIIYVSIDDNEQAQLRMLMDDIWGENNFIGTAAWESKTKCQNTKTARKQFQRKWEYVLLYKNKVSRYEFILDEVGHYQYDKSDEKGEKGRVSSSECSEEANDGVAEKAAQAAQAMKESVEKAAERFCINSDIGSNTAKDRKKSQASFGGVAAELKSMMREMKSVEMTGDIKALLRREGWFLIKGSAKDGVGTIDINAVSPEYRELVRLYFLKLAEGNR